MDRYQPRRVHRCTAHERQVLDLIADYRFFAPAIMARNETHERLLAEAALGRFLQPTRGANRPIVPTAMMRMRLGELLIRIRTQLRGADAVAPGLPPTSGAVTSGAGR